MRLPKAKEKKVLQNAKSYILVTTILRHNQDTSYGINMLLNKLIIVVLLKLIRFIIAA